MAAGAVVPAATNQDVEEGGVMGNPFLNVIVAVLVGFVLGWLAGRKK